MTSSKVDILIPTFNEAGHIADAVKNARALGSVFVLDSISTDGTQKLARDAGAIVVEHPFVNYGLQKNWGLDNLPFTGDWIFILDADERVTRPLRQEILAVVSDPNAADGYLVNRLMLFMGTQIRHGGYYPSWNLRLFRRGKARYEERGVHEHMLCPGPTKYLRHEMLHIRNESIQQWIAKHIKYADLEASEWVKNNFGGGSEANARALFQDLLKYRQYIRRLIWPRLPMRPWWRFFYMYFWRAGFLDGYAGWRLARLMCSYEYTITLLYHEKLLAEERRRRMRRESAGQLSSH
jgi:glycosyltransferase involved in cell wall biosynthesis